jgi:serine protease Do
MYGHLHRGEVGVQFQTVTPALAIGLGLSQDWGPLVSDVTPGSPAETAGLKPRDIIVSVDGRAVDSVPRLALQLLPVGDGDRVTFGVLRGSQALTVVVTATERPHDFDRLMDFVNPDTNVIPRLGILAVDVTNQTAPMLPALRLSSGVVVIGRTRVEADGADTGLTTGDTIYRVNGVTVTSVDQLRTTLATLARQRPIVLQIERNGRLMFLAFELD